MYHNALFVACNYIFLADACVFCLLIWYNGYTPFSEPIGGEITIACESEMFSGTSMETYLAEQLKNSKLLPSEKITKKQGCYYTTIPRVVKQKGIYGEDITSLNIDKVFKLLLIKLAF